MEIIAAGLILYAWLLMNLNVFFIFLIARFYERKAQKRSYYQFFLLPIGLFVLAAARYSLLAGDFVGDLSGDLALLFGGVTLAMLANHLNSQMLGR
ncbi:MAG: hypothetical protein ACE5NP_04645 [Anaerolineae bacterium]